jgi:hypothetical protein
MVKDTLEAHQLPDDFAARIGRIVRARKGVVEVLFDPTSLPDPLTELTVSDQARRRAVTVRVVQLLKDGIVRCVPLAPSDGLAPGMTVLSSGRRAEEPLSREALDGAVRLLTGPPAEAGRIPDLLETGIKVVDVMCPIIRGGTVAIAGEHRAGSMVVVEELAWRLQGDQAVFDLRVHPPGRVVLPGGVGRRAHRWHHQGFRPSLRRRRWTPAARAYLRWTRPSVCHARSGRSASTRPSAVLSAPGAGRPPGDPKPRSRVRAALVAAAAMGPGLGSPGRATDR